MLQVCCEVSCLGFSLHDYLLFGWFRRVCLCCFVGAWFIACVVSACLLGGLMVFALGFCLGVVVCVWVCDFWILALLADL